MLVFPSSSFYTVRSFATTDDQCQQYRSGTTIKYSYSSGGTNGTGSSCAEAIQDFDKNYANKQKHPVKNNTSMDPISSALKSNKGLGNTDILGSAGKTLTGVGSSIAAGLTGAVKTAHDADQGGVAAINKFFGTNQPNKDPGVNPASKCRNCGPDWINPGNWSCQIQKAFCEGGSAGGKAFGDLAPYLMIGGGVAALLILLVILKR